MQSSPAQAHHMLQSVQTYLLHIRCQYRNKKHKQYYTLVVIVDTVVQSSPAQRSSHAVTSVMINLCDDFYFSLASPQLRVNEDLVL